MIKEPKLDFTITRVPTPGKNNDDFHRWIREMEEYETRPADTPDISAEMGEELLKLGMEFGGCRCGQDETFLTKIEVVDNKVNWHLQCNKCKANSVIENVVVKTINKVTE